MDVDVEVVDVEGVDVEMVEERVDVEMTEDRVSLTERVVVGQHVPAENAVVMPWWDIVPQSETPS